MFNGKVLMARGWKFVISGLWVLTHPPITLVKNISINRMAKGWEFIIFGLWLLIHLLITSVKNIILGKKSDCVTMLSDCIIM